MPIVNKRNDQFVNAGGSDLLQVYLETADAVAAYGAGSVAGWYTIAYLQGGGVGPEYASETVKSEAGVVVRTVISSNEFVIENVSLQSDRATFHLFADILPVGKRKYRYLLPNVEATTPWQVIGLYAALADRNNFRMPTGEGQVRTIPFVIRGGADDDGNIYELEDVADADDETTWGANLAAFLTDITQWPT